jgi:hypothetical protein
VPLPAPLALAGPGVPVILIATPTTQPLKVSHDPDNIMLGGEETYMYAAGFYDVSQS